MIGDSALVDYEIINLEFRSYLERFEKEADATSLIKLVRNRPLDMKEAMNIIFYLEDGYIR